MASYTRLPNTLQMPNSSIGLPDKDLNFGWSVSQQLGPRNSIIGSRQAENQAEFDAMAMFFGRLGVGDRNAELSLRRTHYDAPEAYRAKGSIPYLSRVISRDIRREQVFPITALAPLRQWEGGQDISWFEWHFHDTVLDRVPEETVGRLATSSFDEKKDTMIRWGKAMILERGFWKTERGQMSYFYQLKQISNACSETMSHMAMDTLYSNPQRFPERDTVDSMQSEQNLEQSMRTFRDQFGCLNKTVDGLTDVIHALNGQLEQGEAGQAPDVYVFPAGSFKVVGQRPEQNLFWWSGRRALFPRTDNNEKRTAGLVLDGRTPVYLSRGFLNGQGNGKVDPANQWRTVGDYVGMYYQNIQSANESNFKTSHMDILVYCARADKYIMKKYRDMLLYKTGLYVQDPETGDWQFNAPLATPFFSGAQYWGDFLAEHRLLGPYGNALHNLKPEKKRDFLARVFGADNDLQDHTASVRSMRASTLIDSKEVDAFLQRIANMNKSGPQPQKPPVAQQQPPPSGQQLQSKNLTAVTEYNTNCGNQWAEQTPFLAWMVNTWYAALGHYGQSPNGLGLRLGPNDFLDADDLKDWDIQAGNKIVKKFLSFVTQYVYSPQLIDTKGVIPDKKTLPDTAKEIEARLTLLANTGTFKGMHTKHDGILMMEGKFGTPLSVWFGTSQPTKLYSTPGIVCALGTVLGNNQSWTHSRKDVLPLFIVGTQSAEMELQETEKELKTVMDNAAWFKDQSVLTAQLQAWMTRAALVLTSCVVSAPKAQNDVFKQMGAFFKNIKTTFDAAAKTHKAKGMVELYEQKLSIDDVTGWLAPEYAFADRTFATILHALRTGAMPTSAADAFLIGQTSLNHEGAIIGFIDYSRTHYQHQWKPDVATMFKDLLDSSKNRFLGYSRSFDLLFGGITPGGAGDSAGKVHAFALQEKKRKADASKALHAQAKAGGQTVDMKLLNDEFSDNPQVFFLPSTIKIFKSIPLLVEEGHEALLKAIFLKHVYHPATFPSGQVAGTMDKREFQRVCRLFQQFFKETADAPSNQPIQGVAPIKLAKEGLLALLTELYFAKLVDLPAQLKTDASTRAAMDLDTQFDHLNSGVKKAAVDTLQNTAAILIKMKETLGNQFFTIMDLLPQGKNLLQQKKGSGISDDETAADLSTPISMGNVLQPQNPVDFKDALNKLATPADWERLLKMLSVKNGNFLAWCLDNDMPPIINLTGCRPFHTYLMGSAIGLLGGGRTAFTAWGKRDMTFGHDAQKKMLHGAFTMYAKTILHSPQNRSCVQDCLFQAYWGGFCSDDWDPNNQSHLRDMADGNVLDRSFIWIPHPVTEYVTRDWIDITGYINADLFPQQHGKPPMVSTFPAWAEWWNIRHQEGSNPLHRPWDSFDGSSHPVHNTILWAGDWFSYKSTSLQTGEWSNHHISLGPEGRIYAGVRQAWDNHRPYAYNPAEVTTMTTPYR